MAMGDFFVPEAIKNINMKMEVICSGLSAIQQGRIRINVQKETTSLRPRLNISTDFLNEEQNKIEVI